MMDLNYMIAEEWLEKYESLTNSAQTEFLQETFQQEIPPDFLEEIDFLELTIKHYEYLKREKEFDSILRLQMFINEHNAQLFGGDKFYAEAFTAEIHIFRNEEKLLGKSMRSFLADPVQSIDELIPLIDKLVYYNYSDYVQLICDNAYTLLKNNNALISGTEKKFTQIIKMLLLQSLCRQFYEARQEVDKTAYITATLNKLQEYGIAKAEVLVFIQTILGIDDNISNLNFTEEKASRGDNSDDINNGDNTEDSSAEGNNDLFNTLLSLFCVDVLYNKNINFATAADIWQGAWECFFVENCMDGINRQPQDSFKLNKDSFYELIKYGFGFLSNLKPYTFAVVWGLPYVYDFLQKYRLITVQNYNEALECINNVKMQLIEGIGDDIWEYNYVHKWERPDSVSAKAFFSEKELFTKAFAEQVNIKEYLSKEYSAEKKSSDQIILLNAEQMRELRANKVGTIKRKQPKVGRNEPCPCGSGKKFKKCCGG